MIEFWYELASTCSYPAAMRVQRLADVADDPVAAGPERALMRADEPGSHQDIVAN